ncbi:MAG: acyl carrier protein [Planctomycetaceae bacterium]|jgi:acyl carrier protein|nr:acyl carrier protein [Planctomycetaceae bacterium]
MPTKEEIFEGVRKTLVEALVVDEESVTPEATLLGDLGAESIDLLDIVYQLEKTFNIKIEQAELIPTDLLNSTQYVVDGKLTADGLSELRKRMPNANLENFEKNPMIQNLATVLTVSDICYLVEEKVGRAEC